MSIVEENKKKRFQFLHALYGLSLADSESEHSLDEIVLNAKMDKGAGIRAARYLFEEDLITNRPDLESVYDIFGKIVLDGKHLKKWNPSKPIRITHKGIIEIEQALTKPDKETEHFPAGIGDIVKILFLFANPAGAQQLDQDSEFNKIRDTVKSSRYRNDFQLEQLRKVSLTKLMMELSECQPQIVHFSGHGGENGILIFQDGSEEPEWASIEAIANVFRIYNSNPNIAEERKIKLVVLSACFSAKQAKAIAKHVDVVVGMENAVTDNAATIFASGFYSQLGFGSPVKTAFDSGKNQVELLGIAGQDIPRLEVRLGIDPSVLLFAGQK